MCAELDIDTVYLLICIKPVFSKYFDFTATILPTGFFVVVLKLKKKGCPNSNIRKVVFFITDKSYPRSNLRNRFP